MAPRWATNSTRLADWVALGLAFDGLGLPRAHRLVGMKGFERLHPGLLIGGDQVDSLFMACRRVMVERAEIAHRLPEAGLVLDVGGEPVQGAMRLEVGLILKNDR